MLKISLLCVHSGNYRGRGLLPSQWHIDGMDNEGSGEDQLPQGRASGVPPSQPSSQPRPPSQLDQQHVRTLLEAVDVRIEAQETRMEELFNGGVSDMIAAVTDVVHNVNHQRLTAARQDERRTFLEELRECLN